MGYGGFAAKRLTCSPLLGPKVVEARGWLTLILWSLSQHRREEKVWGFVVKFVPGLGTHP